MTVIKIGGAELQEGPQLDLLVEALTQLTVVRQIIVVHGGGSEIAALQKKLG
jgi:acetylglutamate kinase